MSNLWWWGTCFLKANNERRLHPQNMSNTFVVECRKAQVPSDRLGALVGCLGLQAWVKGLTDPLGSIGRTPESITVGCIMTLGSPSSKC
jgi:hypothetical protein